MPGINKQSLKNEFDQLKVRFEELSDEGKATPESSALFQAMFMLSELLIAVFMEKRPGKTTAIQAYLSPNPVKIKPLPDREPKARGKTKIAYCPAIRVRSRRLKLPGSAIVSAVVKI